MSTSFDVGLIITSSKLSLAELAAKLEREPQSGSHDKGTARSAGRFNTVRKETIWRENASAPKAPWQEQCLQLLQNIPPKYPELLVSAPNDISAMLTVAAFYSSAYFDLVLPRILIEELFKRKVDYEITAYPAK